MLTSPLADMFARIKNALMVRKKTVEVPYSKLKHQIVNLLVKEGWLKSVKTEGTGPKKKLIIELKYLSNNEPVIREIEMISKPGRRVYLGYRELKPVKQGYGIAIVTTNQGLMTDREAKKRKVGGEVICQIY